ncbi:hypothetical protein INR49_007433 [Caranx melampygus]|nr:hypothetical protein INR49_007433 [Caranx melampygus]
MKSTICEIYKVIAVCICMLPPVHLLLAHGSKDKTLGDSVDSEQEDVAAVASQQSGAFNTGVCPINTPPGQSLSTYIQIRNTGCKSGGLEVT